MEMEYTKYIDSKINLWINSNFCFKFAFVKRKNKKTSMKLPKTFIYMSNIESIKIPLLKRL